MIKSHGQMIKWSDDLGHHIECMIGRLTWPEDYVWTDKDMISSRKSLYFCDWSFLGNKHLSDSAQMYFLSSPELSWSKVLNSLQSQNWITLNIFLNFSFQSRKLYNFDMKQGKRKVQRWQTLTKSASSKPAGFYSRIRSRGARLNLTCLMWPWCAMINGDRHIP